MSIAIDVARPRFRIGRVFGLGLRLLGANILPYALLAVILLAPNLMLDLATNGQKAGWVGWVHLLFNMIFGQLLVAVVTFGVFQQLRGQQTGIVDCLRFGLQRLPALVAVVFVSSWVIVLYALLLIVPGIMKAMAFWVIAPVCVIERLDGRACRARSAELTAGYRWHIFGLFVIFVGLALLWYTADAFLFHVTLGTTGPRPIGFFICKHLGNAVIGVLNAMVATIGYFDLRQIKDGLDRDDLAAIFD